MLAHVQRAVVQVKAQADALAACPDDGELGRVAVQYATEPAVRERGKVPQQHAGFVVESAVVLMLYEGSQKKVCATSCVDSDVRRELWEAAVGRSDVESDVRENDHEWLRWWGQHGIVNPGNRRDVVGVSALRAQDGEVVLFWGALKDIDEALECLLRRCHATVHGLPAVAKYAR
jgi:hypothetical protein